MRICFGVCENEPRGIPIIEKSARRRRSFFFANRLPPSFSAQNSCCGMCPKKTRVAAISIIEPNWILYALHIRTDRVGATETATSEY